MPARQTDPRVDAYIERTADFARPILVELRALVHTACPAATETIKWGMPFFEHEGMLCFMAAFKAHVAFGFPRGKALLGEAAVDGAMGQLGRLTALSDLPPKRRLISAIKQAAARNEAGEVRPRTKRPPPMVPEDLQQALARSAKARKHFAGFTAAQQREYVTWITEAKREATRARRIADAVAWIAEGKQRNWRYE